MGRGSRGLLAPFLRLRFGLPGICRTYRLLRSRQSVPRWSPPRSRHHRQFAGLQRRVPHGVGRGCSERPPSRRTGKAHLGLHSLRERRHPGQDLAASRYRLRSHRMASRHGARAGEQPGIALVHLGDLLCRLRGLGYGYDEWRAIDLAADPAWHELARHCPKLASIDLARFTLDLDAYVVRITKLVDTIFSPALALTG